jgi:N-acetylglutamate synthase-like GNAT family acetyltransferase
MRQVISIRDATGEDTNLLAKLIREAFSDVAIRFSLTAENCPRHPSNCTTAWVGSDLARGVRYFIVEQGDELYGCVGLEQADSHCFYLERLAVLPGRRKQGFGTLLVARALSYAEESGASWVNIGIIDADTELKQWYTRLGFVEVEKKNFPHLPFRVCFMKLNLNDFADEALQHTLTCRNAESLREPP